MCNVLTAVVFRTDPTAFPHYCRGDFFFFTFSLSTSQNNHAQSELFSCLLYYTGLSVFFENISTVKKYKGLLDACVEVDIGRSKHREHYTPVKKKS